MRYLVLAVAATACAGAQAQDGPELVFPSPTGPYAVGARTLTVADSAREEMWTPEVGDPRRLIVKLWYPADPDADGAAPAYVAGFDAVSADGDDYWADFPFVELDAVENAAPDMSGAPYPLVVFSHGMNADSWVNTYLVQELASHGIVVAAVTHPYWSHSADFGTDDVLHRSDSFVALDELGWDEIDLYMRDGITTLAMDQAFVAATLDKWSKEGAPDMDAFQGLASTNRVGVAGHSMGGMAADVACARFTAFAACASIDGAIWAPQIIGRRPTPTAKPFMLIGSEQFYRGEPEMAQRYLRAFEAPSVFVAAGSEHNTFGDWDILFDERTPETDAVRADTAAALTAFFRSGLSGESSAADSGWPTLEAIDLNAVAAESEDEQP